VQARQFPVATHFSRRTELRNYLEATFKKVCAIHKRLPPGGILVFLTGQREIEWMCKSLKEKFPSKTAVATSKVPTKPKKAEGEQNSKESDGQGGEEGEEEIDYSDIDSSEDEDDEAASSGDEGRR